MRKYARFSMLSFTICNHIFQNKKIMLRWQDADRLYVFFSTRDLYWMIDKWKELGTFDLETHLKRDTYGTVICARFNSLDKNNNLLHLIELQKMSSENNGTKNRGDSEKPRKGVFFFK